MLLSGGVLTSCEINLGLDKSREIGYDSGEYKPYYYSGVIKPKELLLTPCSSSAFVEKGRWARVGLLLMIAGEYYGQHSIGEEYQEFVRMVERLGDFPHSQGYYHVAPTCRVGLETSITRLTVKALSDYNATHPAGSWLTDIVSAYYMAFDLKLKPPYISMEEGGHRVGPGESFPTITHPAVWGGIVLQRKQHLWRSSLWRLLPLLASPSK